MITSAFSVEKEYYCSLETENVAWNWAIYVTICYVSNFRLALWCVIIIQCCNGTSQCFL